MDNDIDLLYEIGTLRYVQRTWKQFLGPDFANNAEHSYRVAWIALVIAKHEGAVDVEKLLKLALVHDLVETRTGDVNYLSRQYTTRNNELAIHDIFDETILNEMTALFQEYETRTSLEAKIVKDADNLDVDFELAEQGSLGNTVKQEWQFTRAGAISQHFYTKTAQEIWDKVQATSPHRWHINGRNRFNDGDWKQLS